MSRTRTVLFTATAVVYAVIVAAVLLTTELVRWDWQLMLYRPYKQWPEFHAFLDYFVVLGQRGPTAVLVAAWLGWRSWRQRTLRPLLVLAAALLVLNVSVGAVKIGLGRLGPHYATEVGSAELFAGGDIFPSGHTANAVVTWGILAYLATTPRARRVLSVVAAVFALGVGATTVYLGTHWLSDVLLGWVAGLIILLGLPWCEPLLARAEAKIYVYRERLRPLDATPPVPLPVREGNGAPVATRSTGTATGGAATGTPDARSAPQAESGAAPAAPRGSAPRGHPTGRAHPVPGVWRSPAPQPFQQRSTVPSRTAKFSRPARNSIVMIASGARLRTVVQPWSRARRSAWSAGSPT